MTASSPIIRYTTGVYYEQEYLDAMRGVLGRETSSETSNETTIFRWLQNEGARVNAFIVFNFNGAELYAVVILLYADGTPGDGAKMLFKEIIRR